MKQWKKILSCILTVIMVIAIVGCGGSSSESTAETANETESVAESTEDESEVEETAEPEEENSEEGSSEETTAETGAPYSVEFGYGTFTLSDTIAEKIANKDTINIVFSYETLSENGASAEMAIGMERAKAEVLEKYGVELNCRVVGPTAQDVPAQVAEMETLAQSGQVDVLLIEAPYSQGFGDVIQKVMDMGIPVFTCNGDVEGSSRIAFYGPNDTPSGNGREVAEKVLEWAEKNNFEFTGVAVTTGNNTGEWSQGRRQGIIDVFSEAYPDVPIYGDATEAAVETGWASTDQYDMTKAFLQGHPDVNFVFNVDWGGVPTAQAIDDLGKKGEAYCVGYNVDEKIIAYCQDPESSMIGTADQNMPTQAENAVLGAMDFLFGGIVPDGEMQYVPIQWIDSENVGGMLDDLYERLGLS